MSDVSRPSEPEDVPVQMISRPNLTGAFLGLWDITWRSRLAFTNLPRMLCFLFAVPVLVWLTIDDGTRVRPYLTWMFNFHLFMMLPLACLATFGPRRHSLTVTLPSDIIRRRISRPTLAHSQTL